MDPQPPQPRSPEPNLNPNPPNPARNIGNAAPQPDQGNPNALPGLNLEDQPNGPGENELARLNAFRQNLPEDILRVLMDGCLPDPVER